MFRFIFFSGILYLPTGPVYSQNGTQYKNEGDTAILSCPLTPPPVSGRTTWRGPPSDTIYFLNKDKNPSIDRGELLSVIPNTASGAYNLQITNLTKGVDDGNFSCEVNTNPIQQHFINLKFNIAVHNISLQSSSGSFSIIEGRTTEFTCKVNQNAAPPPVITWYLNSSIKGTSTISIGITGNRNDNGKTLECRASNNNNKLPKTASKTLTVEYSPSLNALSEQNKIEGRDLSVNCSATPGNPSSTTFYWTKVDNSGFRQNGATLQLPDIQRTSSGTYRCTAENNYSNGEKGTDSQSMFINVLYPPIIENRPLQLVNESDIITMTRDIFSNPLSNVSWYNTTDLLITQTSVKTASFTIERATCTDTMNYTLVASNAVRKMVTAVVELIVHCKPISDKTNITLGVTCTTGIEFSTTIIAYPEPHCELQYENGTRNNHMITTIIKNDVNNFTVQIKQDVVEKSSFGVYHLKARNMFGGTTVIVNVIEQRRPDHPRKLNVICEETGVRVQWISSFNGGEPQYFTVITLNSQDGTVLSYRFLDKGENEIHSTYITNLQPSVTYWFSVSAKNSHGSSSSNVTSCKTKHVKETASSQTGVVAGSVIGALMLVTIIIIIVICAHRQYTCIIGFEKKNRDVKVDTKKDASNYTSIKEQQDHTQRDMYGKLTPNEETNQYEAIRQTDNRGNNEQLYEQLQEKESIAKEGNSDNQNIPLKTKDSSDDKFVAQYAEEYMNTSFVK